MGDIELQSKILKGSNEPISNRELIKTARQVLKQIEFRSTGKIYNNQQLQYINYDSAMASVYIKYKTHFTAVSWKNGTSFMSASSYFCQLR